VTAAAAAGFKLGLLEERESMKEQRSRVEQMN